jgi:hypothetical protein
VPDLRFRRRQGVTEFGRFLPQVSQVAFFGLPLVGIGPAVLIGRLVLEQVIDRPRDFVSGGDQGLHRAELRLLAPVKGAEGTVAADDAGSGLAAHRPTPALSAGDMGKACPARLSVFNV